MNFERVRTEEKREKVKKKLCNFIFLMSELKYLQFILIIFKFLLNIEWATIVCFRLMDLKTIISFLSRSALINNISKYK